MKEKENSQLLKSSVENQWLVNQIKNYKKSLEDIEYTCNMTYIDYDTKKTYVLDPERVDLIGKLIQIKSFISVIETDTENSLLEEIKALNLNLEDNVDQLETILSDKEMSEDVRKFSNGCLEEMKTLQKKIISSNIVVIGQEMFFIDNIKEGELEYCIRVRDAMIGFLNGHIHKLRPEQVPHARR